MVIVALAGSNYVPPAGSSQGPLYTWTFQIYEYTIKLVRDGQFWLLKSTAAVHFARSLYRIIRSHRSDRQVRVRKKMGVGEIHGVIYLPCNETLMKTPIALTIQNDA